MNDDTNLTATVATNLTNLPQVPDTLEPLVQALPEGVAKAVVWLMALNIALAPFSVWVSHRLRDALNKAAKSSPLEDDVFLSRLFSNPAYRTVAVLLRFANVHLPTLAELERAVEFQLEAATKAVHEAKIVRGTAPEVP